jgi:predicted TIM-barrel fold metal-dependent hydrolase
VRTNTEIYEVAVKIIDAHHHFWDPTINNHPWLRELPMIPFRYGDYSSIKSPYLPSHYAEETKDWDVIANITMEGEWTPDDPTGEAIWMQKLADQTGRPAAHVAQAWLDQPDLEYVLQVYSDLPIVRSVRHKPRANSAPGGPAGGMTEHAFRSGFSKLNDFNLMFDLQTPWWHLKEAIDMARLAPQVPIILNHAGLPSDRSERGLQDWRTALAAFAALPQTYVKISGLGLPDTPWLLENNAVIIQTCIDLFGPERAMFASNFPVDRLCGSFSNIYNGFDLASRHLSVLEREALFFKTAASVYNVEI